MGAIRATNTAVMVEYQFIGQDRVTNADVEVEYKFEAESRVTNVALMVEYWPTPELVYFVQII
jgi:hypothetical protein